MAGIRIQLKLCASEMNRIPATKFGVWRRHPGGLIIVQHRTTWGALAAVCSFRLCRSSALSLPRTALASSCPHLLIVVVTHDDASCSDTVGPRQKCVSSLTATKPSACLNSFRAGLFASDSRRHARSPSFISHPYPHLSLVNPLAS